MKKLVIVFTVIVALLSTLLTACGSKAFAQESTKTQVLRIYNCEDYICNEDDPETEENEDVLSAFVDYMQESKGVKVKIEYSTFGTLENMYNELKINPKSYDLVCPSEYMVQKMINEDMLEPFTEEFLQDNNYKSYASPYIQHLFENSYIDGKAWSDYAMGYMWGTLGLVYNPEIVDAADMQSWSSLWDKKYKKHSTVKDSIRDTYFLGLAKTYKEELNEARANYLNGTITASEYKQTLTEILNRTDSQSINLVKEQLTALKKNVFGLEVDSGKNDLVTGKISINFAWSGDAVYAMDEAEADDCYLNFAIPDEGSNIWFDAWVMPKGANVELAQEFINFVSLPEMAINNMEYIGYTSVIAGQEVYDWLVDWYGLSEEEGEETPYVSDLSYFFGGTLDNGQTEINLYCADNGRQFFAQYPSQEIVDRCAIMSFFDPETNEKLNDMWASFKGGNFPVWAIVLSFTAIVLAMLGVVAYRFRRKIFKRSYENIQPKPLKKGVKIISKEEIIYYKENNK